VLQIGGVAAKVEYAAVISPGLYQLNVTVPALLTNGDHLITCTYDSVFTPSGTLLAVQK
jgi:uncharacterized protein (TIGR03437 family)